MLELLIFSSLLQISITRDFLFKFFLFLGLFSFFVALRPELSFGFESLFSYTVGLLSLLLEPEALGDKGWFSSPRIASIDWLGAFSRLLSARVLI